MSPEVAPGPVFDEFNESDENQEVTESINLDEKSQDALNKFYDAMNTQKLSKEDATMYQNRVNKLLRDHFLDKVDLEEIDSLINAIKERTTPRWLRIVNGLNNPKNKNSGYFKNQIKSYCWDKNSGEVNFRGFQELENKVGLGDMFTSHTLKIKINESKRSATKRRIPKNAIKDGDYYVLKKAGDNYVYQTPDNLAVRAVVHQGDSIKEGFKISMANNEAFDVSREHAEAEQLDPATVALSRTDVSVGGKNFSLAATDFQTMSRTETVDFPEELAKEMDKDNISNTAKGQTINMISTLKEDPSLNKLNAYLKKQFKKHEKILREMGIESDFSNLKPNEAVMFVQYLMKVKFGNRIVAKLKPMNMNDPNDINADAMSIMELSKNNEPIVCRNSAQIFEGYMKALKIKGVHIKTTAAETFEGKAATPGLQKEHAWVQMSVAGKNGEIGVMHLDPNWGSQDSQKGANGKRVNFTPERINLTILELNKNPEQLVKTMVKSINEMTKLIKEGGAKPTVKSMYSLQLKIESIYGLDGAVDTTELRRAVVNLAIALDFSNKNTEGYRNKLARFVRIDNSIQLAKQNRPFFLDPSTWEGEVNVVNEATKSLFGVYNAMLDPINRATIESEYNLKFTKVKEYLQNLWDKLCVVSADLFGDNQDYKQVYARLKKCDFPIPKVKYASRAIEGQMDKTV
ncbi:hypothetical protein JW758_03580 [Candidatus Peregrinibacteria bacterium]|nr:hypothetical protein [Candidatus Peregrinibacteria bacterium]